MSKKAKLIIAIPATLVVILIGLFFFLRYLLTKSFPETEGVTATDGISARVEIFRDDLGVPHVHANNDEDLMFATGYVHAQDRLWQMELSRRVGEGRLSEAFGNFTLNFDRMFRTIGIKRLSERLEKNLHPDSRRLLSAYAEGVNFFLATHKGRLPVEFDILGITPEPWRIEHSLMIVRLQAWELNMAWWIELTLGDLVNKVGEAKAREIFLGYPEDGPFILPSKTGKKLASAPTRLREFMNDYRKFLGVEGTGTGSNSWVVSGEKSLTGKPLLANDPHLALPAPSRWYLIHLSGENWNVAGASIPGAPGVVIGRNRHIAWGLTNGMIDDSDFYVERIDSLHPGEYFHNGRWHPLKIREEEISVRGRHPDTLVIRETHRGPIVSDVHSYPLFEYDVYKTDLERNFPLSLRWTGYEMSDEVRAMFLVNKARNWKEFVEGLREFTVPGQSFIYADNSGNIGYWLAARVPIRKGLEANRPMPGWTDEHDWKGFIPFDKLPHSFNPGDNYLVTANNKIVDDSYPYYLSTLWEPPSRFERIRELLKEKGKVSADDFQSMQHDVISPYAREVVPFILQAFQDQPRPNEQVTKVLTYLRNWDYALTKDDVAASIFNAFLMNLLYNTYQDEMGDELYNNYLLLANVPLRVTSNLLRENSSTWFDNTLTEEVETRDDIIRKSLLNAVEELRSRLGGELKNWQWGKLHQLTFQHLFGRVPGMSKVFNIGPFETGGASTTINNGHYNLTRPYKQLVGASMRQVVDLADSSALLIVITSGQSGQPLHKHYNDQTQLWLNGVYHRLLMDRSQIERSGRGLLTLQPSQRD